MLTLFCIICDLKTSGEEEQLNHFFDEKDKQK